MPVGVTLDDAYVVTVGKDHGRRMFYCYLADDERHWIFLDADGHRYDGPAFTPIDHEFQLHQLVSDWWTARQASGTCEA